MHACAGPCQLPQLPLELLPELFQRASLTTRRSARTACSLLRSPAARHTTTLESALHQLPVLWAAFPCATRLRFRDTVSRDRGRCSSDPASGPVPDADMARYLQLCSSLPARLEEVQLCEAWMWSTGWGLSDAQVLQLASALAASPAAGCGGALRSLTVATGLAGAAVQALLPALTTVESLALRLIDKPGSNSSLLALRLPAQLEQLDLKVAQPQCPLHPQQQQRRQRPAHPGGEKHHRQRPAARALPGVAHRALW